MSIVFSARTMFVACGGRSASSSDSDVNPRDTVKVPEGYTGEDSIAYIENAVLKSNISAEDLLGLAEVHSVEDRLFNYNNEEKAEDNPELHLLYLCDARLLPNYRGLSPVAAGRSEGHQGAGPGGI